MKPLAQTLSEAYKNVTRCKNWGSLKSNNSNCENCQNNSKKYNKICVVENIADQWTIESSSIFKGYFHILGGTLSNSNSQRKEDLLLDSLIERVKKFHLIDENFSIENGLLTPTMKVKRNKVIVKYKNILENFYQK